MRPRLPLPLVLIFAASFALGLIALFPLGLAVRWAGLPQAGLSAQSAQGSIWGGAMRGASFKGVPVGDVELALQALPLLWLSPALDLRGRGSAPLDGVVYFGGAAGVQRLDAEVPLRGVRIANGGELEGRLRLENATALFAGKRCRKAGGLVFLDLRVRGRQPGWTTAPSLSGSLQCSKEGVLQAPLRGGDEAVSVNVLATLTGDGAWRIDTKINTASAGVVAALIAAGFAPGPEGAVRMDEGRL
jgi:hypothetical protein